jgi:hypothetical protein
MRAKIRKKNCARVMNRSVSTTGSRFPNFERKLPPFCIPAAITVLDADDTVSPLRVSPGHTSKFRDKSRAISVQRNGSRGSRQSHQAHPSESVKCGFRDDHDEQLQRLHDELLVKSQECKFSTERADSAAKALANIRQKFMYEVRLLQKAILNIQQQRGRKSCDDTELLQQYSRLLVERESLLAKQESDEETIHELQMTLSSLIIERKNPVKRSKSSNCRKVKTRPTTACRLVSKNNPLKRIPNRDLHPETIAAIEIDGYMITCGTSQGTCTTLIQSVDACTGGFSQREFSIETIDGINIVVNPISTRDVAIAPRPINHEIGVTQTDSYHEQEYAQPPSLISSERPQSAGSVRSVQYVKVEGQFNELETSRSLA